MIADRPSRYPAALFLALSGFYLVQTALLGRFPHIDEIAYKAAGFHFATEGVWAAPELVGLLDAPLGVEELWAAYPPVYTAAFAAIVRLFGLGWLVGSLFDALIHVALGLATARFAGALGCRGWAKWLPGVAILPLGTVGRPDELAMIFALLPLTVRWSPGGTVWKPSLWQGIGLGLSGATSPGVGVAFAIVLAVRALFSGTRRDLAILVGTAVVAGGTALVAFAPVLLARPGALEQFLTHSRRYGGTDRLAGLAFSWQFGKWFLLSTYGLLLALALPVAFGGRNGGRTLLGWWVGALLATAWVEFSSPNRFPYLWFVGPILLAAVARGVELAAATAPRVAGIATAAALFAVALGGVPRVLESVTLWNLPADQTWGHNEPLVRKLVPPGSVAATKEFWWSLAGSARVVDLDFSVPQRWEGVTHVVSTGNASGSAGCPVGLRPDAAAVVEPSFRVTHDHLNPTPLTVGGLRLTNSGYGFGPYIRERRGDATSP